MKIVADLHIHSHYSRATSKNLTFEHLTRWAQLKGVTIVGTGDISHPGWLAEMREKLEPAEEGLYRLKSEHMRLAQQGVPASCVAPVRFILSGEISNIYKKAGRDGRSATRKVHNVVFAPDLETVERLQTRLERIGNIRSDGRPILGLDSRDLFETVLEVDARCQLIPAHIWTPWFSALGSKSGFDSIEECYGDLTDRILAVETGLSSDPPMNWRVSSLDRFALVSSSDAHSPEKLAREATIFDTALSYSALFDALAAHDPQTFLGTIEFFPEEGKYHLDGHRACGIVWEPQTSLAHGNLCSVCGKEVTVGVLHRVEELADRPVGYKPANPSPYASLIPLSEVVGEALGVGPGSNRVEAEVARLLERVGPELVVLRDAPLEQIARVAGERLAEGIGRMRRGEVNAQGGCDGEYGVIRLFTAATGATVAPEAQFDLFALAEPDEPAVVSPTKITLSTDEPESVHAVREAPPEYEAPSLSFFDLDAELEPELRAAQPNAFALPAAALLGGLNAAQQEAVRCIDRSLIISAGPGAGKTRTLTHRIAYLVLERHVAPESILAITFTNKAAEEMTERLSALLGTQAKGVTVGTFHAFAASLLRKHGAAIGIDPDFTICAEEDRATLLRLAAPTLSQGDARDALAAISDAKNQLRGPADCDEPLRERYQAYEDALAASHALDFDDLIFRSVALLESCDGIRETAQARYRWISVDEYQDVNAAQVRLLDLLAGRGANLCVIGDPDQAIYGFRGADRSHFLAFRQRHPEAVALTLSENYRSTQIILDAAAQVLAPGAETASTAMRALAEFAEQVKLYVYQAPTDRAEAESVVHDIEQMVGGTSYFSLDSGRATGEMPAARSFSDFAVLYRLSAQSRLLIEAFDRSGIPYQTTGQAPLQADAAVRAVLAHLWLTRNPRSRLHLIAALSDGRPPLGVDVVDRVLTRLPDGATGSAALAIALRQEAVTTLARRERLLRLAELHESLAARQPVTRMIERINQVMLRDAEKIAQLARIAGPFGDRLDDFLIHIALRHETDAYDPRADRVTLMTLHAAKGLEFPVVFIVGCEEGLLPYIRKDEAPDIDEERRLFYVGMTRARERLALRSARKRLLYGLTVENPPSRFVADIEDALKAFKQTEARRKEPKAEPGQMTLF
jgi:DNA helicase-2/ATP-dependent DNA helicase PcrA